MTEVVCELDPASTAASYLEDKMVCRYDIHYMYISHIIHNPLVIRIECFAYIDKVTKFYVDIAHCIVQNRSLLFSKTRCIVDK